MTKPEEMREIVWRQLIDYIQGEDLFFPFKIRRRITEDAYPILDEFIQLMLEREMLVEFQRKNFFNRIAHWFYTRKIRKQGNEEDVLEVYIKGPNWLKASEHTYAEISGQIQPEGGELTH
jgi:hypothetical protein